MIVSLYRLQHVALEVLARHVPRGVLVTAAGVAGRLEAADAQPLALAERVEAQPDVAADDAAAVVFDCTRRVTEVAIEKLAKRPLANEADAGGVLLLRVRQPNLGGDLAYLRLLQFARREERAGELSLVQAVQEVTLVLAAVAAFEQL